MAAEPQPPIRWRRARQAYNDAAVRRGHRRRRPRRASMPQLADARPSSCSRARISSGFGRRGEPRGSGRRARRAEDDRRDDARRRAITSSSLIGLGESLYLDDQYSSTIASARRPSCSSWRSARADLLDARGRDRLFEWWAQSRSIGRRSRRRGRDAAPSTRASSTRAERELARPTTAVVRVVLARGGGARRRRSRRARGARRSPAGFAPASLGARGAALRDDLDRSDACR